MLCAIQKQVAGSIWNRENSDTSAHTTAPYQRSVTHCVKTDERNSINHGKYLGDIVGGVLALGLVALSALRLAIGAYMVVQVRVQDTKKEDGKTGITTLLQMLLRVCLGLPDTDTFAAWR
jgi:hypothetical protein